MIQLVVFPVTLDWASRIVEDGVTERRPTRLLAATERSTWKSVDAPPTPVKARKPTLPLLAATLSVAVAMIVPPPEALLPSRLKPCWPLLYDSTLLKTALTAGLKPIGSMLIPSMVLS